jgi:hypothetical protein
MTTSVDGTSWATSAVDTAEGVRLPFSLRTGVALPSEDGPDVLVVADIAEC